MVYNVRGALYAIVNYCSHEGALLCRGLTDNTNEYALPTNLARYVASVTADRAMSWHS